MLKDEWLTTIVAVFGRSEALAAVRDREMRHVWSAHKAVIAHQGTTFMSRPECEFVKAVGWGNVARCMCANAIEVEDKCHPRMAEILGTLLENRSLPAVGPQSASALAHCHLR